MGFLFVFLFFERLQGCEHYLWAIPEPLVSARKGHGSVPTAALWPRDELFLPAQLPVGVSGCLVTLQTTAAWSCLYTPGLGLDLCVLVLDLFLFLVLVLNVFVLSRF